MNAPLKTFRFEPITAAQIRDYCEASGDWNKIHHDEQFAKEAGLPGIIAHGMLSMGLAACAFEEWGYAVDRLKRFDAKFKDKVVPGDVLTAELLEEKGELRCRIVNQSGSEILTASAQLS